MNTAKSILRSAESPVSLGHGLFVHCKSASLNHASCIEKHFITLLKAEMSYGHYRAIFVQNVREFGTCT